MSDPVGGRGAEREVVARAMYEQGMGFDIDAHPVARESMLTVAESILVALDAERAREDHEENGRLLELRQKTVQLLEAIDAGLEA